MEKTLINKVANSGLITINLENYYPDAPITLFDLKDYLFKELILKEKDYRAALKEHDWSQYQGHILCVYCSNDAIIPTWAYMLVSSYAEQYVSSIYQGDANDFLNFYYHDYIHKMDVSEYADERLIIKGCSNKPVPPGAYMALTQRLRPLAKSIMYGEPCSTVPIYKQPRQKKTV